MHPMPGPADLGAPADQATVRRLNLVLLMREVISGGPRSRARLAEATGLNKATVSSLVSELTERRLIRQGRIDRSGVGRPGTVVEVDTCTVRCVGLEMNVDYVAGVITDLGGAVLAHRRVTASLRELGPAKGIAKLAQLAQDLIADSGDTTDQVETVNVSVPGLIDSDAEILAFAPNMHWRQVDVVHSLAGRLKWERARIALDNDANLGAMAEYAIGESAGSNNMLYVVGEIGVGAGLIVNGRIVRGHAGFAGEIGHMPIGPANARCDCGRLGCWETTVGLRALINATAGEGELLTDITDAAPRLVEIVRRADAGDRRTLDGLAEVGRWLGIGAAVLANLLDPEVIVLGGHFSALQKYLRPSVVAEMKARMVAEPQGCRLEFSSFGFDAPVLGAAHAGIDRLIGDPTLVALR